MDLYQIGKLLWISWFTDFISEAIFMCKKAAFLAKSIDSGELTCNPTTTSNLTIYKVSDIGNDSCDPQWSDVDNHILANGDGKNDSLVFAVNITTLHTYNCYNTVMYVLDCYPKPNKNVTCVANCSESAGISIKPGNKKETLKWVIPVICTIVMLFLVIGVICYRRRHRRNQRGLCSVNSKTEESFPI